MKLNELLEAPIPVPAPSASKQQTSTPWIGKDGKMYRNIKFWTGNGWSEERLQVQDNSLKWYFTE